MTTIRSRQMPDVRPVAVQDLQLGDCLITPLPDGRWGEGIVYYLDQEYRQANGGSWHCLFDIAPRRVVLDRILNPGKYTFKLPPLAPYLADLTDAVRLAMRPNPQGHVRSILTVKKKTPPALPLLRATDRSKLLLNGVDERAFAERQIDLHTLRHAAQALRPDKSVTVKSGKIDGTTTIKAIGFGMAGPLGVLLFAPPGDFSAEAAARNGIWQILTADFWVDASKASISLVDPNRNGVQLKRVNHLKQVEIPHA